MSLTTDPKNPHLNKEKPNGQNEAYLILSDEERAKGFVRPVRTTYKHVGVAKKLRGELHMLEAPENHNGKMYVAIDRFTLESGGRAGSYLTAEDVERIKSGKLNGCGAVTTMALPIAETYARDPKYYGATFCVGCRTHLPVGEFVWVDDGEVVGS